jgi:hypothetical protein
MDRRIALGDLRWVGVALAPSALDEQRDALAAQPALFGDRGLVGKPDRVRVVVDQVRADSRHALHGDGVVAVAVLLVPAVVDDGAEPRSQLVAPRFLGVERCGEELAALVLQHHVELQRAVLLAVHGGLDVARGLDPALERELAIEARPAGLVRRRVEPAARLGDHVLDLCRRDDHEAVRGGPVRDDLLGRQPLVAEQHQRGELLDVERRASDRLHDLARQALHLLRRRRRDLARRCGAATTRGEEHDQAGAHRASVLAWRHGSRPVSRAMSRALGRDAARGERPALREV